MLRRGGGGQYQRRFYSKPRIGAAARLRLPLLPRFTFRNFSVLVFTLVVLASLPSLYQRFFQTAIQSDCKWLKQPPLVCAHGGDSSRAPPNTLAAYQLAIDVGVDCIEIDASRTWDGVLLALHDRDLQKMSEQSSVRVGELTANKINELDATTGFLGNFPKQHVPTVEDAIQYVHQSVKEIIIDAKVGPPLFQERLPADLISLVKSSECTRCLVWSKDDKVVREIIRRSANTKTGYIVMNDTMTGKISELLRFEGAEVVGVHYGLVTQKMVKVLHRAKKKVHAWTVNTADAMIGMLKAGVDAIITNDPRLLQGVMLDQKQLCMLNGFTAF
ncbi:unnamed protein product [Calypogeia fissa]